MKALFKDLINFVKENEYEACNFSFTKKAADAKGHLYVGHLFPRQMRRDKKYKLYTAALTVAFPDHDDLALRASLKEFWQKTERPFIAKIYNSKDLIQMRISYLRPRIEKRK